MSGVNVTEVKLYKSQKEGSVVKAFGKATINNELVLDILVMENGNGAWATFPNGRKSEKDGKYYLPVFFKTKEKSQEFNGKVLEAYQAQVVGGGSAPASSGAPAAGSESLPF